MADIGDHLRFPCPRCGVRLKAPATQAGQTLRCPRCEIEAKVPVSYDESQDWVEAPKSARGKEKSTKDQDDWVPVVCRVCQTRIYAKPVEIGQGKTCPDCHTINLVKPPPPRPLRKKFESAGPDYELSSAPPVPLAPVLREKATVTCEHCALEMEILASVLGSHISCPRCDRLFLAPAKPSRPRATGSDLSEPAVLGSSPLATRSKGDGWNEEDWLSLEDGGNEPDPKARGDLFTDALHEAKTRGLLERNQQEDDDPPAYPFFSGVWTFPFYEEIRITLIFLAMLLVPLHYISARITSVGAGAVEGGLDAAPQWVGVLFLVILGGVCTAINLVCWGVNFLPVVQDTASGYDHIRNWTGAAITDWLGATFNLISSMFFGAVLGGAGFMLLGSLGIKDPRLLGGVLALGIMLTQPFWMICLIDSGNPFIPWSPTMGSSLFRTTRAWIGFLFLAMPLSAVMVGSLVLPSLLSGVWQTAANWCAPCITVVAAAIYFRLVGRIAWISGQDETDRETEMREAERKKKKESEDEEDENALNHRLKGVSASPVPYEVEEDSYDPFA